MTQLTLCDLKYDHNTLTSAKTLVWTLVKGGVEVKRLLNTFCETHMYVILFKYHSKPRETGHPLHCANKETEARKG